jgi:hypothetical protein
MCGTSYEVPYAVSNMAVNAETNALTLQLVATEGENATVVQRPKVTEGENTDEIVVVDEGAGDTAAETVDVYVFPHNTIYNITCTLNYQKDTDNYTSNFTVWADGSMEARAARLGASSEFGPWKLSKKGFTMLNPPAPSSGDAYFTITPTGLIKHMHKLTYGIGPNNSVLQFYYPIDMTISWEKIFTGASREQYRPSSTKSGWIGYLNTGGSEEYIHFTNGILDNFQTSRPSSGYWITGQKIS